MSMRAFLLTALAMLAFATNSILCRMALGEGNIDAASFTSIRLISGAVTLVVLMLFSARTLRPVTIRPIAVLMLFAYAICFSFSYIEITAGTGALILFGAVQLTMISYGLVTGERPGMVAWLGMLCAVAGLIYLLIPGVSAPPLASALLMVIAGIAAGIYTLQGRGSTRPLLVTGWNFVGTLPLVLLTYLVFRDEAGVTQEGVILAMLSGALASGVGYAVWYKALPYLTATRAATVQLTVPVIAAIGGVVLLAEPLSLRLIVATIIVLGGVYLTIKPQQTPGTR